MEMFQRQIMVLIAAVMVYAGPVPPDISTLMNTGTVSVQELPMLWAAPEEVEYEYFCPMHKQVVSDKPGKCPVCGMPLSRRPRVRTGEAEKGLPEVPMMQLSPRQIRIAGIKTEAVAYRPLTKRIYTVGNLTYDERRLAYATAWVGGRVDKLFVDFTGTEVKKGEPLVWIYSPDLVSTQQEYLLALETAEKMKDSTLEEMIKGTDFMVEASRKRLLLWGITEEQIAELERTKEVQTHMTIYSPISGTVIEKNVLEGQYVEEGTKMYTVADLTNLWMMAEVYEYEMALVKLGQKVEITTATFPGQTFIGEVSFIDPFINEATRSVKVRVDVPNPELKLKPSMFVNATIKVPLGGSGNPGYYCPMHPEVTSSEPGVCDKCGGMELVKKPYGVLSISRSAVLDTGLRKIVYVQKDTDLFEAREIKTGFEAEGYVEVLEGLREGEVVASAGAFLIDAETQLGPGVGAQYYGASGGPEEEEGAAPPMGGHAGHGAHGGMVPKRKVRKPPKTPEKEAVVPLKVPKKEAAVQPKAPPAEVPEEEMRPIPIGASPIDPVCGMEVRGTEAISAKYGDSIFFFDSIDCKRHFESDPEFFARRHWAFKEEATVDPVCGLRLEKSRATRFTYLDKEYYFCCEHCKRAFREDPEKYISGEVLQEPHRH